MKINLKNKIKGILLKFGIKISKEFKIIPLFKSNVFNKKYEKKVLISYITESFVKKNDFSHTNLLECYTAAEIFDELGFCVDVINFDSNKKINYNKYEVIYGMGNVLEKSFYFNEKPVKKIFYATGCNPFYSNIETLLKVRSFKDGHGKTLIGSSRFIEKCPYLQILLSDKTIVLGNDFVLNTYTKYDTEKPERFENLNAFFYDVFNPDLSSKNFSEAKKHFLWFGSSGLLHKGLDILIDIFSEKTDTYLHICGAPNSEKDFFDYYNPILNKSKNIINHGFVDMKSEKFKSIINQCAFTISPSVSEGGSPAILNTIANGGLIPIVTESSGLDIDNFGIIIEKPEKECVNTAIKKALLLNNDELLNMSNEAKNNIRENYTHKKYKETLKETVKKLIQI